MLVTVSKAAHTPDQSQKPVFRLALMELSEGPTGSSLEDPNVGRPQLQSSCIISISSFSATRCLKVLERREQLRDADVHLRLLPAWWTIVALWAAHETSLIPR